MVLLYHITVKRWGICGNKKDKTFVKTLKSISAVWIFRKFPNLKNRKFWGSGLWSKGYYIGTAGTVSADTIRKYIENQKNV
jgi:putative transposase